MATVWEAEHTKVLHRVAIKIMKPIKDDSPEFLKRFAREAKAAGEIAHPNIVKVFDVGVEDDGTAFMVMELLKGISLADLLRERGSLPPQRVIDIVLQVLSALLAAHRKGIIHRDLKPANIFLALDERMREAVKLLDFGIAKKLTVGKESTKLTTPGSLMGTPHYFSPEQAAGDADIDQQVDIWAIGVIMHEMLTGQHPFDGERYSEVICKILLEKPRPMMELAPRVSLQLSEIVSKAMDKDRASRFSDVFSLINALAPLSERDVAEMETDPAFAALDSRASNNLEQVQFVARDERLETSQDRGESFATMEAIHSSTEIKKRPRLRWVVVAGVVAVLLIAIVGFMRGRDLAESDRATNGPSSAENSTSLVNDRKQPHVAPAGRDNVSTKVATDSSVGMKEEQPEADRQASPEMTVKIVIDNLPPKSQVFVGGKPVSHPVQMARSKTQTILKVRCPGYLPYVQRVTPSRDLKLHLDMKKRRPSKVRGKKDTPRTHIKGWKDSPF